MISVIIPVYNEEKTIRHTLDKVSFYKDIEIILVDGGSCDKTLETIKGYPVEVIHTIKNRAYQLNQGADIAKGDIFLFLHADCFLESVWAETIKDCINRGFLGGCFTQKISSSKLIYRIIEKSGNIRAKAFKIFYGDQAIFVRRDIFFRVNGFDKVDLFDDVLFSKKLKQVGKICVLNKRVYVSPRRWERQGVIKTTVINWLLSIGFLFKLPIGKLRSIYYDVR